MIHSVNIVFAAFSRFHANADGHVFVLMNFAVAAAEAAIGLAILADEFLQYFDGFSIGSNDLTQLTLGLDRDSALVAHLFDERNPAILKMLSLAIQACKKQNKYVGICGQGPSDYPDLAAWLLEQGISSLSLNPDTVIESWLDLAQRQRS